jgi:hypothetical protein
LYTSGAVWCEARNTVEHHAEKDGLVLDWLGAEGDALRVGFAAVFGPRVRAFGKQSTWIGGLSDGHDGVQWNAGYDPRDGRRWVGVNLEGMQYDGWPIARLIRCEMRSAQLPEIASALGHAGDIEILWLRDYWQASARPSIKERFIHPTPIQLRRLTPALWHEALLGALTCLDQKRGYLGRATQRVTLVPSMRVIDGPVSPHLTIEYQAAGHVSWREFLYEGKQRLTPVYDWATRAAG